MKYYVKCNGRIYGPVDENKIQNHLYSGFFNYQSQVSTDLKTWNPVQQCITNKTPIAPAAQNVDVNTNDDITIKLTPDINDSVSSPNNSFSQNIQPQPNKSKNIIIMACCFILLAVTISLVGIIFINKGTTEIPNSFSQVYQKYQPAVGVVVVTLEDTKGMPLSFDNIDLSTVKVGTAWAFGKNKFATNSHVAYDLKVSNNKVINRIIYEILLPKMAIENGAKTLQDVNQYITQYIQNNKEKIAECQNYLNENIRFRGVEIRLAHSNGHALNVTHIQAHPRYRTDGFKDEQDVFRNAEFDIAILTTAENVDTYFKLASKEKLYSLVAGQEIAYIGFPMEGLILAGNIDINNPEAVLKQGRIGKITDFNNVSSHPELNKSIIHDIPSTGGASGSPIFLPSGEVIAILWGGNHDIGAGGARIVSAALHDFATRIDVLDTVKNQKMYTTNDWLGNKK